MLYHKQIQMKNQNKCNNCYKEQTICFIFIIEKQWVEVNAIFEDKISNHQIYHMTLKL